MLSGFGKVGFFVGEILQSLFTPPFFWYETIENARKVAYQCFLPVVAILFPTGMISALMGLKIMALFGTERMLSSLLAQSIVKEMAPSLAGIMIAAQAGSAIAGEIGSDQLTAIAAALPGVVVGGAAGLALRRHVDAVRFRRLVVVLLVAAGISAIASARPRVGTTRGSFFGVRTGLPSSRMAKPLAAGPTVTSS